MRKVAEGATPSPRQVGGPIALIQNGDAIQIDARSTVRKLEVPPRPAPALRGGRGLMCSQACLLGLTFVREKPKVLVSEEEMAKRKAAWKAPPLKATKGTLYKYIKVVESPPRTNWTRRVPHPVLIGHVSSFLPY